MKPCFYCGEPAHSKKWLCDNCWQTEASNWKGMAGRFIDEDTNGEGSGKVHESLVVHTEEDGR
jgi:hypothetical protein